MTREVDVEQLYDGLTILARRSRERSGELHPGLSLVDYSLLTFIDAAASTRASDIALAYGLDKSTVSRQIDQLVCAGMLVRDGERPGRRGQALTLTSAGEAALCDAAGSVRAALVDRLADWNDRDVANFARLLGRFNERQGC
jgi:DNA-binding MarR family transcriptional regulator